MQSSSGKKSQIWSPEECVLKQNPSTELISRCSNLSGHTVQEWFCIAVAKESACPESWSCLRRTAWLTGTRAGVKLSFWEQPQCPAQAAQVWAVGHLCAETRVCVVISALSTFFSCLKRVRTWNDKATAGINGNLTVPLFYTRYRVWLLSLQTEIKSIKMRESLRRTWTCISSRISRALGRAFGSWWWLRGRGMVPKFNQVAMFQAVAVRKWSLEPALSFLRSIYTSKSLSLSAHRERAACWPWHPAHSLHFRVTQLCLCWLSLYQEDTSCSSVLLNSKSWLFNGTAQICKVSVLWYWPSVFIVLRSSTSESSQGLKWR